METLRATEIYRDRHRTLVAVESVGFHPHRGRHVCRLDGQLHPVAIVVRTAATRYAIDPNNHPLELDALLDRVPGLAMLLDGGNHTVR